MTGICFLYKDQKLCKTDITKVWFRKLRDAEIWDYIHTHNALDKAGALIAYKIVILYLSIRRFYDQCC